MWEDDQPHLVTREQSDIKIIVTANEAKGPTVAHNKWWIQQSGASQQGRGEGTGEADQNLRAEEKRDSQHTNGESEEQEKSGCVKETTKEPKGVAGEQAHRRTLGEERGGEGASHRGPTDGVRST